MRKRAPARMATNSASAESALLQKLLSTGAFFQIDADALYAFKSRGFGGEIGLVIDP